MICEWRRHCSGIPALERFPPGQPARPDQVSQEVFDHIRHGTTTIIGNPGGVSDEMIACTIGPTRTEQDFVNHIAQTSVDERNTHQRRVSRTIAPG